MVEKRLCSNCIHLMNSGPGPCDVCEDYDQHFFEMGEDGLSEESGVSAGVGAESKAG